MYQIPFVLLTIHCKHSDQCTSPPLIPEGLHLSLLQASSHFFAQKYLIGTEQTPEDIPHLKTFGPYLPFHFDYQSSQDPPNFHFQEHLTLASQNMLCIFIPLLFLRCTISSFYLMHLTFLSWLLLSLIHPWFARSWYLLSSQSPQKYI